MSDLSDLQSALTTKVAGANGSGTEINFLAVDPLGGALVSPTEPATYSVLSINTPIALNKSMIGIGNTSTNRIKIHKIQIINVQSIAVTGITAIFELRKLFASSGGTIITPVAFDSLKPLPSGINSATNVTVTNEGPIIKRWLWSTDEWSSNVLDLEGLDHAFQTLGFAYNSEGKTAPIVLNTNEGIHIKQTASSTVGTFDIYIEFTVE